MATVQRIGYAQNRGESARQRPSSCAQVLQIGRIYLGRLLAMPAHGEGNHLNLRRLEAEQLGVLDQVIRVTVVTVVVNRVTDIMKYGRELEQFPAALRQ